jgi:acetyl esterase/lipase
VGDAETLLDDSTRVAEKAKTAGVKVDLEIWPEMPHVWHLFAPFLPEGQQAIEKIGKYVQQQTA